MGSLAQKRLLKDLKRLQDDPMPGISAKPSEDNIFKWTAILFGPDDTPFEYGTFKLLMEFDEQYPNRPPVTLKFVTKIFHPNVFRNGQVCLDMLSNRWNPTNDIASILSTIQELLGKPNLNTVANTVASQLFKHNIREYNKRVRHIVERAFIPQHHSYYR